MAILLLTLSILTLQAKQWYITTSAGTQGIANACYADEILTGSFVNALAISKIH